MTETIGALIIGGNLNGLSIARSLGRQGVPVWVLTTPNIRLASFSRYTQKTLLWPNGEAEAQAAHLLALADRYRIEQWALFPTSDETAALLSKFHTALSPHFRVSTPKWDVLRWAYDKRLTYQLASEKEVDYPATFCPADEAELHDKPLDFPVVLKPATHAVMSRFTADKAWPAANREELLARYRDARELIAPDEVLVQERIPGGGESQFSYAGLYRDGQPIATLTARRTRQYPIDFGYSSSFVETMDVPEITGPSQRLLSEIRYTGLVEVEYKLDRRNGRYKLLDINPRLWTWAALGDHAGVDFPYLLWRMLMGKQLRRRTAGAGFRWVRMSTDFPSAIHEMFRGRLSLKSYLHSLRGPIEFALMAADDPLPGLLDLPLYAYKHVYNGFQSLRGTAPLRAERLKD
jgi:predicted ATP-grasp superfamily ATP-dependent carboligase